MLDLYTQPKPSPRGPSVLLWKVCWPTLRLLFGRHCSRCPQHTFTGTFKLTTKAWTTKPLRVVAQAQLSGGRTSPQHASQRIPPEAAGSEEHYTEAKERQRPEALGDGAPRPRAGPGTQASSQPAAVLLPGRQSTESELGQTPDAGEMAFSCHQCPLFWVPKLLP